MPEAASSGGYKMNCPDLVKRERRVVWDLVKQMGQNITQLDRVALPVTINEGRSYLERIADGWCFAPQYLNRAAACVDDPLERFKLVVTFVLSGLHNTCRPGKPFNPILGETFEATFKDGTQIFCEQTSHHPPVTSWEVLGPNQSYHFYGYGEWTVGFRGNSVKGHQTGPNFIVFQDGTKISWNLPESWCRGVMFGDRIIEYMGEVIFEDKVNDILLNLVIAPSAKDGFFSFKKKLPSDYIQGEIMRKGKSVSVVDGSWLGSILFDDKPYWDFQEKLELHVPIPVEFPLPSDSRYREDLVYRKVDDCDNAKEWKLNLETLQRNDRKLREEGEQLRQNGSDLFETPIDHSTEKLELPASPFPPPKTKAEAHSLADSIGSATSPEGRKKMRNDSLKAKSSKDRVKRNKKKGKGKNSAEGSPPTSARTAELHQESSHKKSASLGSWSP